MKPLSPFQYNRWESDRDHIIWLPPNFSEWEGKRCVYFTGSRGSGKTTLLRGFEWYHRLNNDSLKAQLDTDPFVKRYIGIYLSMPDYITTHFSNFPPRKSDINEYQWEEEKARVYSLYLEYQILQLFIRAIQGLRGENFLNFRPEHELDTVKKILSERPEIKMFISKEIKEPRLNDLRLCFKQMHENIRHHAIKKRELQPEKGYPSLQMGQMLEEIAGILIDLCSIDEKINKNGNNELARWTLKICIDQTESPELYQQKAINTAVARQVTGDVSFAIAALSGRIDINSTYIPQHPLTDADREHYSLEEVYKKRAKFHEFVTSVTNLRFKNFTGLDDSVDLRHLLGEWDLNALLYPILKSSENKTVREFIKKSEENIGIKLFDFKRKKLPLEQLDELITGDTENEGEINEFLPDEGGLPNIPPLYQTYLVDKLNLKFPHELSEEFEIRAQKSREIRKKMTSAMLCLCREYGLSVPYAGYYMVMSMSDQCIRDFLRQMHEIYLSENVSPEKFVKKQINPKKQNEAIRKASEGRYNGISYETPYYVYEVRKLVDYLGKITADIQSAYNDPSTFKTIEKGRFQIDYSHMDDEDVSKLKDILNIAKDSYYIKEVSNRGMELFRLHRLFAPRFGFSYRGAYSNVLLEGSELLKLCAEDDEQKCKIVERIVSNIVKTDKIMKLDNWID